MSSSLQQFYLERESNPGSLLEVFPTYSGQSLDVTGSKDTNNFFFREEISQELCFDYNSYSFIVNADLSEVFYLHIYRDSLPFWVGTFTRTDCKINPSAEIKTVKVKPKVYDNYTKILEFIDKEYDLIKLSPPKTPVTMTVPPVLQVYVAGSQHINSYVGGVHFEQPVTALQDDEFQPPVFASTEGRTKLVDDFKFSWRGFLIFIPGDFSGGEADLGGRYGWTGTPPTDPITGYLIIGSSPGGTYHLETDGSQIFVVIAGTATVTYQSVASPDIVIASGSEGLLLDKTDASGDQIRVEIRSVFSRVLCNEDTFLTNPTFDRPEDDISAVTDTYKKIISYGSFVIEQSYDNQVEYTEYGIIYNDALQNPGNYFVKPVTVEKLLPISQSDRVEVALWVEWTSDEDDFIDEGTEFKLVDCYNIADVLLVLLQEIDSTITHGSTTQYSTFLHGTNPISAESPRWFITPKSNILAGQGAQAATRSPIKLSEVNSYMRNKANLYWHITSDKELIIEHASYYEKGKSYSTDQVSVNLSELYEPRTRKNYEYGLSEYSYDIQDMPNFIIFRWMDEVTKLFRGEQIEMTDAYTLTGKDEDRGISRFTTDLTFAFVSPDQVSNDGYFGLDCVLDGDDYVVPFVPITFDGEVFQLNNGYASFVYLHDNYFKHFLPSRNVIINKQSVVATSIRKNKEQVLEYPEPARFDPMELVTTGEGVARLKQYTIELWKRYLKITAKHDIE